MAWIEAHQSLLKHRKTLRAAALLGCDRHKLIGHLMALWWWSLDNTNSDGYVGGLSDVEIATAAEWPGEPEPFVRALLAAGFIDDTPEGRYLHDWYDYAGKLMERREADKERLRASRRRTSVVRASEDVRTSVDSTQPNPTVPNPTQPYPTVDADDPREDADFKKLQERWERRTGKPVSASAALELTALLRDFGLATVQRAWKLADMNGTRWASPRYLRPICEQIAEQQERAPPEYEPGRGYPGGRYSHLFQQGAAGDGGADDG